MLQTSKKKIAVFGGTFDPPHMGHSLLAEKIITYKYADEVMFIPALSPPHKPSSPTVVFQDRIKMVKLAADLMNKKKGNFFKVSDIEGERTKIPSYTFDTMVELDKRYPGTNFIILIGEDSLLHLHTWYKADKLINNWKIITYPRNCTEEHQTGILEELRKKWPDNIAYLLFESILPYELCDISSTEVREKLSNQLDVSNLIYPEVHKYIKEKGLYKSGK